MGQSNSIVTHKWNEKAEKKVLRYSGCVTNYAYTKDCNLMLHKSKKNVNGVFFPQLITWIYNEWRILSLFSFKPWREK